MGSIAVGIDLGTTYCCVAKCDPSGKVEIIANEHGRRTTPSYVAFTENERFIGEAAKSQAGTNPKNTVFGAKRLIGRKFKDEAVQQDLKLLPFEIVNDNNKPKIKVEYKNEVKLFFPEEISAMLLERMKQIAENHFSKKVTEAVITVPAYFNDAQRQATKDAGRIAGLNVMRVINEPTAAAIAYGLQNSLDKDQSKHILVFDLGGGTFDITVMAVEDEIYEVKSTNGDTRLGGEDFDNSLIKFCVEDIQRRLNSDITKNSKALSRLKTACETAKISLSTNKSARITLDSLVNDKDYTAEITQKRFNELNEHLFQRVMNPVKNALKDAKLEADEVSAVVMVGGSTKIPRVSELLREYFTKAELKKDINADEAVAYGAAILATKMNAEEMSEALQEMTLLDVTPLSLGIETVGGSMSVIVDRNTTVPVSKEKEFLTHRDNQTTVNVQVYEGERPFTKDNNQLGNFRLSGIHSGKVGTVQIIVKFDINTDGILEVTATQKRKGVPIEQAKEEKIKITNIHRHSEEEIREMIKRAEDMRLDDEKEKERVKCRMNIESLCLKLRSTVMDSDMRNKMNCNEREKILISCTEVLSWIDCNYNAEQKIFEEKYRKVHEEFDTIRREAMTRKSAPCDEEEQEEYTSVD